MCAVIRRGLERFPQRSGYLMSESIAGRPLPLTHIPVCGSPAAGRLRASGCGSTAWASQAPTSAWRAASSRVTAIAVPAYGGSPASAAYLLGVVEGRRVLRVRQRPGDLRVVPEEHAGEPGHANPGHLVAGRGQCHLVPDRRFRLRQVRVAAEESRLLARDRGAVRGPRVAVGVMVELRRRQPAELGEHARRRARHCSGVGSTSAGCTWSVGVWGSLRALRAGD
jgi:hypothetical protein